MYLNLLTSDFDRKWHRQNQAWFRVSAPFSFGPLSPRPLTKDRFVSLLAVLCFVLKKEVKDDRLS